MMPRRIGGTDWGLNNSLDTTAGIDYSERNDMDYIPDPIERGEMRCEDWEAENVKGDIATCCCGRKFKLADGETVSADPYAIPVCPICFEEWVSEREARSRFMHRRCERLKIPLDNTVG